MSQNTPSAFDNTLLFSSGDVAQLSSCTVKTARDLPIPWFHIPKTAHRRCTRNALFEFLDQRKIDTSLGTLTPEFLQERRRIVALQDLTTEEVHSLLAIGRKNIAEWVSNHDLISRESQPHERIRKATLVSRDNLLQFMKDHSVPAELASGYIEDDPLNQMLTFDQIIEIFARYLCDESREHAVRKLEVLLDVDTFPSAVGTGKAISIPCRDIRTFVLTETGEDQFNVNV